ncbi:NAD-dependent epimerase/dehydratase family protein [Methylobacterium symbioticum]|uniref:NAD-dependent epimerase/dehydratase domain-containing protein n=1 Tax=Methylobacterium symbioticum TaxID=2584084 RepID=A0A509EDW9_9HYPH|nr:NAD-dependent epimerase/dehydratase family protein [Methylobacterium symbioticum]VUD71639.1 hypothetical protein MET9862_02223 [Methylobacterium symbioticum]
MHGKTALVLGATGGVGGVVAAALVARGWRVRGLARDVATASARWAGRGPIDWIAGDALERDAVIRAADGVSALVHAVNPPGYRHWDRLVLPMVENSIAAARRAGGARIVLPGTVYNFDPTQTPVLDEDSPQAPQTCKGRVRAEMERRLVGAAETGVPCLIVRAGDYFGPGARSSWFHQVMVRPGGGIRRIVDPNGAGIGHSWAYLPDFATAVVGLMELGDRLRPCERVQFEGLWDSDGSALPAAIRRAAGTQLPLHRFPWWLMRCLSPFGGFPREVAEIEPHWRHPVRFDNRRLVELLGAEPRTPLDEAVRASLRRGP